MKSFKTARYIKVALINATLLLLTVFLLPLSTNAKDVTFQWTAVPEPLTGYRLYYNSGGTGGPPWVGTELSQGASPILVGKVTSYTVTGLLEDETYHFVLTAFNENGESGQSAMVTVSPQDAPVIINITVQ
ncbi:MULTISPECIES: fibronectin type III domain-containing protein [Desulfosediminicola]|uniref:fibronectin type III domain-containing protein n=1 Tax=Desulfosediminicola TaxID=2886823 RepID=UPI0010ABAEFA|nr:fibronectin type III domain-containing protein [Desulfosediminicola ganghwensis]